MPSSLIAPPAAPDRQPLTEVLASVPDPRARRGRRHPPSTVLTVAVCAVLPGARSLVAIAGWAAEADREALATNGIDPSADLPTESTIRRVLAGLDADVLDRKIAGWMTTRTGWIAGRPVIAIDGKTLRGARRDGHAPHLLAALHHGSGAMIGQRAVGAKTNEIPELRELIDTMDIAGAVITADALHCQTQTATHITGAGGHYVLTVKANQRGLYTQLKELPWNQVPATRTTSTAHGRRVTRTIKAIEAPAWIDFPQAAQVVQLRRTRTLKGRKHIEVVYVICSLSMTDAPPADVTAWIQRHWGTENKLHWVRDVTFDEDRHQLRTGSAPQVMAALRNTAISLIRLSGRTHIAVTLRHNARDSRRPIQLLATS